MKQSLSKAQALEILKMALCLLIIAGATALMLAAVNALTKDRIAEQRDAARNRALREILPADEYTPIDISGYSLNKNVTDVFAAKSEETPAGVCVAVNPAGFAGPIFMLVGVNPDGAVTGARIIGMSETSGMGTKTNDPDFLSLFEGKSGIINLVSGAAQTEDEISAISGATVSSRAVAAGVQLALDTADQLKEVLQ